FLQPRGERAMRRARQLRQRRRDTRLGLRGHAHRDRTGREQIAAAVHDARAQAERAVAALVAEELGLELRPQLLGILVDEAALAHHRGELAHRQRLAVAQLREHRSGSIAERRADTREPVGRLVSVDVRHLYGPVLAIVVRRPGFLRPRLVRATLGTALLGTVPLRLVATPRAARLALLAAAPASITALFPALLA